VVLVAVVAAAAIAGSLSLSRKTILRVPKKLGDEGEEVTRLPGRQGMLPSAYDPHVFFSRKDTNATANWGAGFFGAIGGAVLVFLKLKCF
jgi:hypothetical protein